MSRFGRYKPKFHSLFLPKMAKLWVWLNTEAYLATPTILLGRHGFIIGHTEQSLSSTMNCHRVMYYVEPIKPSIYTIYSITSSPKWLHNNTVQCVKTHIYYKLTQNCEIKHHTSFTLRRTSPQYAVISTTIISMDLLKE